MVDFIKSYIMFFIYCSRFTLFMFCYRIRMDLQILGLYTQQSYYCWQKIGAQLINVGHSHCSVGLEIHRSKTRDFSLFFLRFSNQHLVKIKQSLYMNSSIDWNFNVVPTNLKLSIWQKLQIICGLQKTIASCCC